MVLKLEFLGATVRFNPWRGCEEVSPACDFCYAREMAKRNPAVLGKWGPRHSCCCCREVLARATEVERTS